MRFLIQTAAVVVAAFLFGCGADSGASPGAGTPAQPMGLENHLGADGAPMVPTDYTGDGWTSLGTWSVAPKAEADVVQHHVVWTETSAAEAYRSTGKWPDGTTLVKELRDVKPTTLSTGRTAAGGTLSGWFVMVKRQNAPAADTPHWGDGWHGAQYLVSDRAKNVSPGWQSCRACHLPVQDTDWVFVDGYPGLER